MTSITTRACRAIKCRVSKARRSMLAVLIFAHARLHFLGPDVPKLVRLNHPALIC